MTEDECMSETKNIRKLCSWIW